MDVLYKHTYDDFLRGFGIYRNQYNIGQLAKDQQIDIPCGRTASGYMTDDYFGTRYTHDTCKLTTGVMWEDKGYYNWAGRLG